MLRLKLNADKQGLIKILLAAASAVLPVLYADRFYSFVINRQSANLLLAVFGGLLSFDGFGVIPALAFCLLFTTHLALLGNEFRGGFQTASAYLFTRGLNRGRWLARQFINTSARSWLYYFIIFSAALCFAAAKGYAFDAAAVTAALACLLFTFVLTNTCFILTVNMLTLRANVTVVYAAALAFYAGWIALLPLFRESAFILRLVPVTRGVMLMHERPAVLGETRAWPAVLPRIPVLETALLMFAGAAVVYTLGWVWLKRTDLLGVDPS